MRGLAIGLFLASYLFGLSDSQIDTVKKIREIAKKHTAYPTTIAGISIVESSAGANPNRVGDDGKSFGVLQIQTATVRWLSTEWRELEWTNGLSDHDIGRLLLTDLEFSVMVACLRFEQVRQYHGYFKAVSAYNGGYDNHRYVRKVNKAKRLINREVRNGK